MVVVIGFGAWLGMENVSEFTHRRRMALFAADGAGTCLARCC
jgi:hypothetical protein